MNSDGKSHVHGWSAGIIEYEASTSPSTIHDSSRMMKEAEMTKDTMDAIDVTSN